MYKRHAAKEINWAIRKAMLFSSFEKLKIHLKLCKGEQIQISDNIDINDSLIGDKAGNVPATNNDSRLEDQNYSPKVSDIFMNAMNKNKKDEKIKSRVDIRGIFRRGSMNKESNSPLLPNEQKLDSSLIQNQGAYEENKKLNMPEMISKKDRESKELRIGDIIYFQHAIDATGKKEIKGIRIKGVISGDGISTKKLECISRDIKHQKNAYFNFRKCLFRVETVRKYYHQKQYFNLKRSKEKIPQAGKKEFEQNLKNLEENYNREKKENDSDFINSLGQSVLYGQPIQFRHMHSGCFLTFQPNIISKYFRTFELTLDPHGSEYSEFKFLSPGGVIPVNNIVYIRDSVNIVPKIQNYYFHIQYDHTASSPLELGLQQGFEVNLAGFKSDMKLLMFTDHNQHRDMNKNSKFLMVGDIVQIYSKKLNKLLGTAPRNLNTIIVNKLIQHKVDEENNTSHNHNIKFIDMNKITAPIVQLYSYRKYCISDLWEIQKGNNFGENLFGHFFETFRIKHLGSGLFLTRDPIFPTELRLTPNGSLESCNFVFESVKSNFEKGKIEFGDLVQIKSVKTREEFLTKAENRMKEDVYLQSAFEGEDPNKLVKPAPVDKTLIYFEFKRPDEDVISAGNRASSLFPFLLSFYQFFQTWGLLESNVQKDEAVLFDYKKAIDSERDLVFATSELLETLNNLESYMKARDNLTFTNKQKAMLEQQVTELLILIAEIIDTKIFGERKTPEKSNKKEFHRISDWKKEHIVPKEKTAMQIAYRHLHSVVRRIYQVLYLLIENNVEASYLILRNDIFLSGQLALYQEEVGRIFKEAIQNSAHMDEIEPWVDLLEMIKETTGNIVYQILYLDILSLSCLDLDRRGISRYQNKILQKLFSPNSHPLKSLIQIHKVEDRCLIHFSRGKADIMDFIKFNPSLFSSDDIKPEQDVNKHPYVFNLEQLCSSVSKYSGLIINYISSCFSLFYSLCKDRNEEGITHVKSIGFNTDVIMRLVESPIVNLRIKHFLILLYNVLYIDVEPYRSIEENTVHSYIWEEIDKSKVNEHTFEWHNSKHFSRTDIIKDYEHDKVEQINNFLTFFWNTGKFTEKGISNFTLDGVEWVRKARLFQSVLEFTKYSISLGFTNAKLNNTIVYGILHLLIVFDPHEETLDSKNWISRFILQEEIHPNQSVHEGIFTLAMDVLKILADLRVNIQMTIFLKLLRVFYDFGKLPSRDDYVAIFQNLFQIYSLDIPNPKIVEKTTKKVAEIVHCEGFSKESNVRINHILADIVPDNNKIIPGSLIILNTLSGMKTMGKNLRQKTNDILKMFFDQREILLDHLMRIETLCGKRELSLFSEFESPGRLDIAINKILQEDDYLKQNLKIDNNGHKTRIIDLTNSVYRMINKFKERKHDPKLTHKSQNIMRNLKMHKSIFKIFKLNYREKDHQKLFKSAINLLFHFSKKNVQNQKEIQPQLETFLRLIPKKLKTAKVIINMFVEEKTSEKCSKLIDEIFSLVSRKESLEMKLSEYFIILRNLTLDDKGEPVRENQAKMINRLLTNKTILNLLNNDVDITQDLLSDKQMLYRALHFQSEAIQLVSIVSRENRSGMIIGKKILPYERLKPVISNPKTHFLVKKSYVRSFFQLYLSSHGFLNQEIIHALIFFFKDIVIEDLKYIDKHIEGIVDTKSLKGEKLTEGNENRENIKGFMKKITPNSLFKPDDPFMKPFSQFILKKSQGNYPKFQLEEKLVEDHSEFWDYLISGKNWEPFHDGLLQIIIEVFVEIEKRELKLDSHPQLNESINQTRIILSRFCDLILKIEDMLSQNGKKIRFTKFTIMLNKCQDLFPYRTAKKDGVEILDDIDMAPSQPSLNRSSHRRTTTNADEGAEIKIDTSPEIEANDVVSVMIRKMKTFIIKKQLTLGEFISLFNAFDDKIEIEQFKIKLKTMLGANVSLEEMNEFIKIINRKKEGHKEINLNKILKKLQKSFEKDRIANFKENAKMENIKALEDLDNPNSAIILRALKSSVENFREFCVNKETKLVELKKLGDHLYTRISNQAKGNQLAAYSNFLLVILTAFKKQGHKIYMLNLLKFILKKHEDELKSSRNDSEENNVQQQKKIRTQVENFAKIQSLYVNSGIAGLCIDLISDSKDKEMIMAAADVLILLLQGGNSQIQATILEFLKTKQNAAKFLGFIKTHFRNTCDRNTYALYIEEPYESGSGKVQKRKEDEDNEKLVDIDIASKLLRILQLFCENCYIDFQNFLRNQQTHTEQHSVFISINIVSETSNLFTGLHISEVDFLHDIHILVLIQNSLEAIIDFCLGPCPENQAILANQRHLILLVNSFLDRSINFTGSNETDIHMITIFALVIKLLLSLVNANRDMESMKFLLDRLDVQALINKLALIYSTKVQNRDMRIFREERKCTHTSVCTPNYCMLNYITKMEFTILEAGFDIYILLKIFVEFFPQHPSLNIFNQRNVYPKDLSDFEQHKTDFINVIHRLRELKKLRLQRPKRSKVNKFGTNELKKTKTLPSSEFFEQAANPPLKKSSTKDLAKEEPKEPEKKTEDPSISPSAILKRRGNALNLQNLDVKLFNAAQKSSRRHSVMIPQEKTGSLGESNRSQEGQEKNSPEINSALKTDKKPNDLYKNVFLSKLKVGTNIFKIKRSDSLKKEPQNTENSKDTEISKIEPSKSDILIDDDSKENRTDLEKTIEKDKSVDKDHAELFKDNDEERKLLMSFSSPKNNFETSGSMSPFKLLKSLKSSLGGGSDKKDKIIKEIKDKKEDKTHREAKDNKDNKDLNKENKDHQKDQKDHKSTKDHAGIFSRKMTRQFTMRTMEEVNKKLNIDKEIKKLEEDRENLLKQLKTIKQKLVMSYAHKFFESFIRYVEIDKEGVLSKNYFQVPFECVYISKNIKEHVIRMANRNSNRERIDHFFFNIPLYWAEMRHRQSIATNKFLEWFVDNWKNFKDVAFILIVTNCIVNLAYRYSDGNLVLGDSQTRALNFVISLFQLMFSILIYIFGVIERLPFVLYVKERLKKLADTKDYLKQRQPVLVNTMTFIKKVSKFISAKIDDIFIETLSGPTKAQIVLRILLDPLNFYNLIYLIISIFAFVTHPLMYAVLLLDIVWRFKSIRYILKGVTQNLNYILRTFLLFLISTFYFAIVAFYDFRDSLIPEESLDCNGFSHCWAKTIDAIRKEGGFGSVLEYDTITSKGYGFIFALLFYIIVVLGLFFYLKTVIIDSFWELREKRIMQKIDIQQKCYICSLNKRDFEMRGKKWIEHIYGDHNVWNYLNFIIYIKKKEITECNGVEKYVKDAIEKNEIIFMPQNRAMVLEL